MSYIYPTFSRDVADDVFRAIQQQVDGEGSLPITVDSYHDQASFAALGGNTIVPMEVLMDLRSEITGALDNDRPTGTGHTWRDFDAAVGRILLEHFSKNGKSQAANLDTWAYLTLALMPDVALRRFPPGKSGSLSKDRFTANRHNIFYSRYIRAAVLGDLLIDEDLMLFEDELMGLLDRQLSSDRSLARLISNKIASLPRNRKRRDTIRQGLKEINFELRVTDLGRLPASDLETVLDMAFTPR